MFSFTSNRKLYYRKRAIRFLFSFSITLHSNRFVDGEKEYYINHRKDCNLIVMFFVLHASLLHLIEVRHELFEYAAMPSPNFGRMVYFRRSVWFIIIAFPPLTEFLCHFVSKFAFPNRLHSIRCINAKVVKVLFGSRLFSLCLALYFGRDGSEEGVTERRFTLLWFIQTE